MKISLFIPANGVEQTLAHKRGPWNSGVSILGKLVTEIL